METKKILITSKGRDYLQRGGVWIFANEFQVKMNTLKRGEWAEFFFKSEYLGYGYVNPHSLIAGRICTKEKVKSRKDILHQLILKSLERRDSNQTSFRAVFAESDNLPGLIIDVYKNIKKTVVVQSTTAGMDGAYEDLVSVIQNIFKPEELVWRGDSSIRALEGIENFSKIILGNEENVRDGAVLENDLLIAADFLRGQKTGFFIDQRENRLNLRRAAQGKTVLDLCCYSGGWGLSALKGGARHVTFVDQSSEAMELVKKGVVYNQFKADVNFVVSDVFDYLKNTKEKFDLIICDPPAFVKSKKNITQAEKAYFKLNSEVLKNLKPGGAVFTCSCSYHLAEERFIEIVGAAFQAQGLVGSVIYRGSQSLDHPWVINRPESHYLKCLGVQWVPN